MSSNQIKENLNNEDDFEGGEDEDNENENMLVQMKEVDEKKNIFDWNLLTYEGQLSRLLVSEFEDETDGKNLI